MKIRPPRAPPRPGTASCPRDEGHPWGRVLSLAAPATTVRCLAGPEGSCQGARSGRTQRPPPSHTAPGPSDAGKPTARVPPGSGPRPGQERPCGQFLPRAGPPAGRELAAGSRWPQPLPCRQFQALLTLFSKSFAPFPHGTCMLSDSRLYLALDGLYHPFRAVLPNNPTLRSGHTCGEAARPYGTLTLCGAPFQGTWAGPSPVRAALKATTREGSPPPDSA